jgi:hypothetical protein
VSLSAEALMKLMALADDELDGDERAEAEALVATNEDARRAFETMRGPASRAIGDFVATSALERTNVAETIAGAVMEKIAETPKVASLDAARARRDARLKASAMLVAAASIAAGAFFYLGGQQSQPLAPPPVASGPTQAPSAPVTVPMPSPSALASADPAPAQQDEGPEGPEVTIESTDGNVTIFHVPGTVGANVNTPGSVIVWIDDKPQGK